MKNFFRAIIFLTIGLLSIACSQAQQITPLPTDTPIPSQTATPQIEASPTVDINPLPTFSFDGPNVIYPTPNPNVSTLLPTIDPTLIEGLLHQNLSIQTPHGVNSHNLQKITGWSYGFGQHKGNGYQWLDSNHLLLYPRTGEGLFPARDSNVRGDLSSQPVLVNLETGSFWLPWSNTPTSIYFSRELGIVFLQETYGSATGPTKEAVFTYTFDGQEIARYWGKILGVSPSGEKILVDDDTIIDLNNGKIMDLAWHMEYDLESWSAKLYWSSDENRVYRCCFYYADLKTGKSYNLEWTDLQGKDGKPISFSLRSPHVGGRWVRNDTYFFPTWDYMSDAGDPRMIFSPAEKKYYFIELSSTSTINPETMTYTFSPDGVYAWITGFNYGDGITHNFLINLNTLETTSYNVPANDFVWASDSKFGLIGNSLILSTASKKLLPLPVTINLQTSLWHPKDPVLAYLIENNQTLALLNAKDVTVQELKLPTSVGSFLWSPRGDRLVFTSTDGSLWKIDYPKLEALEQLTPALPNVTQVNWSPDGISIAFISGADIYIVDTIK